MEREPIRVAQMMTDMNYGGVEAVVMNYYRHIDRTRVQFDFFALEGSTIPQREEIEKLGGRVYIVPKYTHPIKYEKAIVKIFKENNYKIVHSHMNTLSIFSLFGAKIAGIPNRIIHNHSTAGKGDIEKNVVKYLLRPFAPMFATEKCACSKLAGEWMYGKKGKFTVFNNAIDLDKYKYDKKVRNEIRKMLDIENKKVIGHVGRFSYQKNHDLLIDIFYEFLKRENDAVLMLIGEGELEGEIKNKVKKLGIEKNVLFLGKKDGVYRYYQAMDIFLLPSRYEGLPVVGVEAQANGLPCIFSDYTTKEVKLLKSSVFVKNDVGEYVNNIQIYIKRKRTKLSKKIKRSGFDIKTESYKLSNLYLELQNAK